MSHTTVLEPAHGILSIADVREIRARWDQTECTRMDRRCFSKLEAARLHVAVDTIYAVVRKDSYALVR